MSCQDPLSLEANRRVISRKLETRLRLEECIAESDLIGIFQEGVGLVVRVDVEEDRHVDLLTRVEPLLLETEALDLVEVGPGLKRNHIVGRNPVDRSEIFYIETSRCRPVVTCLWDSSRCKRRVPSLPGGRAPLAAGDGSSIFRKIIQKIFPKSHLD